jgi:hypothetical protein
MENDPDEAAKPMGNGPDGLIMSQKRYQSAIENFENGSFRLGCGVGSLIQNAPHVAVTLWGPVLNRKERLRMYGVSMQLTQAALAYAF